jgi:hypothetical protein
MAWWYYCYHHGYLERVEFNTTDLEYWTKLRDSHMSEYKALALQNCDVMKAFRDSNNNIIAETKITGERWGENWKE